MSGPRPTVLVLLAATAVGLFAWWIMQPPPGFTSGFPGVAEPQTASREVASPPTATPEVAATPHRVAGFDNPEQIARPRWAEDDSPATRAAIERQLTRLDRAHETLLARRTRLASEEGRDTALIVLDAHLAKLERERAMLRGGEQN